MRTTEANCALQQATEGLTYPSETDAPWKAFHWPTAEGEPTPETLRTRGRHRPDAPAAVQSVDEFFAPLVEVQDWFGDDEKANAAKYQALLDAVKKHLRNPKVVKVGERKIAVYVVGEDAEVGWTGLKTTAVET